MPTVKSLHYRNMRVSIHDVLVELDADGVCRGVVRIRPGPDLVEPQPLTPELVEAFAAVPGYAVVQDPVTPDQEPKAHHKKPGAKKE
jgi:hypothetical protein